MESIFIGLGFISGLLFVALIVFGVWMLMGYFEENDD